MLVSNYSISSLEVQTSSMVLLCLDSHLDKLIISIVSLGSIISSDDHKRFERFIHLGLLKFSGAIGEDAYELFVDCKEKLHNLGSLEFHRITYTTYQLTNMARDGWGSYLSCNLWVFYYDLDSIF